MKNAKLKMLKMVIIFLDNFLKQQVLTIEEMSAMRKTIDALRRKM